MPLCSMLWDDINLRGNPTCSNAINDVITKVKKYEVRQEGVSSKARRAFKWEEFYALLMLACHLYATVDVFFFMVMLCLQWQIIARIGDVIKLAKSTLLFNSCEPSTLNIKMNWSKNIREERDCPTQILFGAMDPLVCPLLNLVAWLERGRIMVYCCLVITVVTDLCRVFSILSFPTSSFNRLGGGSLALTPFARGLHLMWLALASVRIGLAPMVVGEERSSKLTLTLKCHSRTLMLTLLSF